MAKLINQHCLYPVHTAPQAELVSAILFAKHIIESDRTGFSGSELKILPASARSDAKARDLKKA